MPCVAVMGTKGGVGASLVATNLAVTLQDIGGAILVDLNLKSPSDDLLLDLRPERSWADLLPVAGELTGRHLELSAKTHERGLSFLAPPAVPASNVPLDRVPSLIQTLTRHFGWVVLDLDADPSGLAPPVLAVSDLFLVVTTPDPPALRGARRLGDWLASDLSTRTGLVINQLGRFHPVSPYAVAQSLGWTLMGLLPREPQLVADQVNFGRAAVLDRRSSFAQQITQLAERLGSAEMGPAFLGTHDGLVVDDVG